MKLERSEQSSAGAPEGWKEEIKRAWVDGEAEHWSMATNKSTRLKQSYKS